MKRYRSYILVFGLLVLALIINIAIDMLKKQKIHKEFPSLLIKDSINEIIASKPTFKGFRSWSSAVGIVTLTGKKFTISANINPNFGDGSVGINDITEPGDRIYKKANNDTIYVYKNKAGDINTYYFIWTEY